MDQSRERKLADNQNRDHGGAPDVAPPLVSGADENPERERRADQSVERKRHSASQPRPI